MPFLFRNLDLDFKMPDLTVSTVGDLVWDASKSHTYSIPAIKHIQFNEKTGHTAIVWEDGSETTVVKCVDGEKFEPYAGFCAAIVKKLFGTTSAAKRFMNSLDVDAIAKEKEEAHQREAAERREQEARNHDRKIRSMAKRLRMLDEATKYLAASGDLDGDDIHE